MATRYLNPAAGGEPTHFEQDGWIYELKEKQPVFYTRSIEGRNLVRADSGRTELFFG